MVIEQIVGRSMREALLKAREKVGDRAVVLSHISGQGAVTLAVTRDVPKGRQALGAMRKRAEQMLEKRSQSTSGGVGTLDLERRLLARGASRQLTERVAEAVAGRLHEEAHPLDLAGEELGAMLQVARASYSPDRPSYLAFVGAAGVGKTTSLTKLAARLVGSGKRVLLVTLDLHRIGAVEQMKALGKELGCPVMPLRDARELARPFKKRTAPDVVLIDTSGRPEEDSRALSELRGALHAMDPLVALDVFLVAPAVQRPAALEETLAIFDGLGLNGTVVTKVDETARPVPVLEFLLRRDLPLAFVADGRGLDGGLHRAGPELFADLFLQGKVR